MPDFREVSGYSIVSAILPRHTSADVIKNALLSEGFNALSISARGTLLKDRWYQSFLPVFNRFGFNSPKLASFLIHKV